MRISCLPHPFLVDVPGYNVRVAGLSAAERQRNLDALRFASDEAAARGLHFQLGLWTQAYEWVDSPDANYVIEGLNPSNHAAWREVFRGVVGCGRRLELDLHPKGVGPEMIQVALETGLPVTLSPKYTAEHMGLPAHQVEIRSLERTGDPFREADGARSAGASVWSSANHCPSRAVAVPVWQAVAKATLTSHSAKTVAPIGRSFATPIVFSVASCMTPRRTPRCGSARSGRSLARRPRRRSKRRWPVPVASSRSSRPCTTLRPQTTGTGQRCTRRSQS
jgi:hypothetical protein